MTNTNADNDTDSTDNETSNYHHNICNNDNNTSDTNNTSNSKSTSTTINNHDRIAAESGCTVAQASGVNRLCHVMLCFITIIIIVIIIIISSSSILSITIIIIIIATTLDITICSEDSGVSRGQIKQNGSFRGYPNDTKGSLW